MTREQLLQKKAEELMLSIQNWANEYGLLSWDETITVHFEITSSRDIKHCPQEEIDKIKKMHPKDFFSAERILNCGQISTRFQVNILKTCECLERRSGIKTMEQFMGLTERDFLCCWGCGGKTLNIIRGVLKMSGFYIGYRFP